MRKTIKVSKMFKRLASGIPPGASRLNFLGSFDGGKTENSEESLSPGDFHQRSGSMAFAPNDPAS